MTDLISWLLEQIAEDERAAQAAVARSGAEWAAAHLFNDTAAVRSLTAHEANPRAYPGDDDGDLWDTEGALGMHAETAAHVATWDPARVLAECRTKRAIIDEHHKVEEYADPIAFCSACGGHPSHGSDWPCYTLRLLALPYADKPGFREEWRP